MGKNLYACVFFGSKGTAFRKKTLKQAREPTHSQALAQLTKQNEGYSDKDIAALAENAGRNKQMKNVSQ